MHRKISLLLFAGLVAAALAWFALRINVESGLESAAGRDLRTIIDLVSAEVLRQAETTPASHGPALARAAAGPGSELAQSLQRIRDEHLRTVYFFDGTGRILSAGEDAAHAAEPAAIVPAIVPAALLLRRLGEPVLSGTLMEPYPDASGTEVVGAWRWLPGPGLGVVAERPYAGFARPLRWIDGLFAALAGLLVLGLLFNELPELKNLPARLRQPGLRRCGPYVIQRLLGEGAMANVYLARHRHLGRTVALKLLKGGRQSDELTGRFAREARLGSRLSHPNIVTIFDHGKAPDGGFYYTMEYIHGMTLPEWVETHGPLPPARTVRILEQICAAVGAMHRAGLLHRDIKPDNVMAYATSDDYDLVKLIDFGLIRNLEGGQTRDLTRTLRVLGTPAFMAPERLLDPRNVDPRTDLYGIGCIAFYLLTGRKPFEATQDGDLTQQILHVEAPPVGPLSPFPAPAPLAALIRALLAKDINQRPASAALLADTLAAIALTVPWRRDIAGRWWRSTFPPAAEGLASAPRTPVDT